MVVVAAAIALATPGKFGGTGRLQIYDASRWAILVALAVVAVLLALREVRHQPLVSAVGVVLAAQLGGTGVNAVKHWRPASGAGGGPLDNFRLLIFLAVVLAIGGVAGALACALVFRSLTNDRRVRAGGVVVVIACAIVLTIGFPFAVSGGYGEFLDLTSVGAYTVLFTAPWSLGLILGLWLDRRDMIDLAVLLLTNAAVSVHDGELVGMARPLAGVAFTAIVVSLAALLLLRMGSADLADTRHNEVTS